MILDAVVADLDAQPSGNGYYQARCPAHDDDNPSLSLWAGEDGGLALKCFAGCSYWDVFHALGYAPNTAEARRLIAAYDYRDESGAPLYQVVRYGGEPKKFTAWRRDAEGRWTPGIEGVRRVLYRLPELCAADPATTVFVVEGEKDADNLAALGLVATTNPFGAGKWRPEYSEALRGRDVVVLPDDDAPGRKHMEQVAQSLGGVARRIRVLALPEVKDASDWIAAGGSLAAFLPLVQQSAEWRRSGETDGGLHFRTSAELRQRLQDAQPTFLVADLLVAGNRLLIYAFAGVGKSMLGLHLAISVNTGTPFLGYFATKQANVGYIDEESDTASLAERLKLIYRGHDIDEQRNDLPLFSVLDGARLDTPDGVEHIFEAVLKYDLEVLIIDTLRRVHRLRENEADDMAKIELAIKALQARSLAELARPLTLVLLHHAPKPRMGGSAPETMARGSSDIFGWIDSALYLKAKGAEMLEVEHAKARWRKRQEPFLVAINSTATTLRMEHAGSLPTKQDVGERLRDFIVKTLGGAPEGLTQPELVEHAAAVGFSRTRTVQETLRSMVKDAVLIETKSGRSKLYTLAADPSEEGQF